jgi:hypothetical protein
MAYLGVMIYEFMSYSDGTASRRRPGLVASLIIPSLGSAPPPDAPSYPRFMPVLLWLGVSFYTYICAMHLKQHISSPTLQSYLYLYFLASFFLYPTHIYLSYFSIQICAPVTSFQSLRS